MDLVQLLEKGGASQLAYWLDEDWHSWPEIVRAGTAAAGLYARCGCYIADHLTDGFIPADVALRMYGTPEWARRLVEVGLWRIEGDGYYDERYFPLNSSSEVIRKRKADAAERQRRKRSRHGQHSRESRVTTTVTNISPEPLAPLRGARGGARAREAAPLLKPHPFAEDPATKVCTCGWPKANKIHSV